MTVETFLNYFGGDRTNLPRGCGLTLQFARRNRSGQAMGCLGTAGPASVSRCVRHGFGPAMASDCFRRGTSCRHTSLHRHLLQIHVSVSMSACRTRIVADTPASTPCPRCAHPTRMITRDREVSSQQARMLSVAWPQPLHSYLAGDTRPPSSAVDCRAQIASQRHPHDENPLPSEASRHLVHLLGTLMHPIHHNPRARRKVLHDVTSGAQTRLEHHRAKGNGQSVKEPRISILLVCFAGIPSRALNSLSRGRAAPGASTVVNSRPGGING